MKRSSRQVLRPGRAWSLPDMASPWLIFRLWPLQKSRSDRTRFFVNGCPHGESRASGSCVRLAAKGCKDPHRPPLMITARRIFRECSSPPRMLLRRVHIKCFALWRRLNDTFKAAPQCAHATRMGHQKWCFPGFSDIYGGVSCSVRDFTGKDHDHVHVFNSGCHTRFELVEHLKLDSPFFRLTAVTPLQPVHSTDQSDTHAIDLPERRG